MSVILSIVFLPYRTNLIKPGFDRGQTSSSVAPIVCYHRFHRFLD